MRTQLRFICIFGCLVSSVVVVAQNKTTGQIRLKKNVVSGKNLLTSDMMNEEYKTYIIRYAYDLNGGTLIVPKGVNLKFKRNGSISNGSIVFSNTWLKNERFYNLKVADGTLLNNKFETSRYGFLDDTEMFRFLLKQVKDGYVLRLESKKYQINTLKDCSRVKYDSAFDRYLG